jgi:hypothetical protein
LPVPGFAWQFFHKNIAYSHRILGVTHDAIIESQRGSYFGRFEEFVSCILAAS